jgi:hypothetical protein
VAGLSSDFVVGFQSTYKSDETGKLVDRYRVSQPPATSAEGYQLVWNHSSHKAELDAMARARQPERTWEDLAELQEKLKAPRARYRRRAKVIEAVEAILQARGTTAWVVVAIDEREEAIYRQERLGRPNTDTTYRREVAARYELRYELDQAALMAAALQDGVFPLITNDRVLSERALLLAYKGQPVIERRYAQLMTEFAVAPAVKSVSR